MFNGEMFWKISGWISTFLNSFGTKQIIIKVQSTIEINLLENFHRLLLRSNINLSDRNAWFTFILSDRRENQVTLGEIQGCAESISRGLQSRENDVKAYEMAV